MYTFAIEGEGDTALPSQEPVTVEPEDTQVAQAEQDVE